MDTPKSRRLVSGWCCPADCGSRKRITAPHDHGWPLRHSLRRWCTDGSVHHLRAHTAVHLPVPPTATPPYTVQYRTDTDSYTSVHRPVPYRTPTKLTLRTPSSTVPTVLTLRTPTVPYRPWDIPAVHRGNTGQSVHSCWFCTIRAELAVLAHGPRTVGPLYTGPLPAVHRQELINP